MVIAIWRGNRRRASDDTIVRGHDTQQACKSDGLRNAIRQAADAMDARRSFRRHGAQFHHRIGHRQPVICTDKERDMKSTRAAVCADRMVSMSRLVNDLSSWAHKAREEGPVLIMRYEEPWVCMVDYHAWLQVDALRTYQPPEGHPLAGLRRAIDTLLAYEAALVLALAEQSRSGLPGQMLIRAWLLQIVYSVGGAGILHEALAYNMRWRWFVGYDYASQPLPAVDAFVRDMAMVSADSRVIDFIFRCLDHSSINDAGVHEFSVNTGLIQALRARSAHEAMAAGGDRAAGGFQAAQ